MGGDRGGVDDPGPSSVPEFGRVWAQANVAQTAVATNTHVLTNSELAECDKNSTKKISKRKRPTAAD
jgi:hypothetical protein